MYASTHARTHQSLTHTHVWLHALKSFLFLFSKITLQKKSVFRPFWSIPNEKSQQQQCFHFVPFHFTCCWFQCSEYIIYIAFIIYFVLRFGFLLHRLAIVQYTTNFTWFTHIFSISFPFYISIFCMNTEWVRLWWLQQQLQLQCMITMQPCSVNIVNYALSTQQHLLEAHNCWQTVVISILRKFRYVETDLNVNICNACMYLCVRIWKTEKDPAKSMSIVTGFSIVVLWSLYNDHLTSSSA